MVRVFMLVYTALLKLSLLGVNFAALWKRKNSSMSYKPYYVHLSVFQLSCIFFCTITKQTLFLVIQL